MEKNNKLSIGFVNEAFILKAYYANKKNEKFLKKL